MATSEPPKLTSPRKLLAILSGNIEGLSTARGKHKLGMLCERAKEENIAILSLTESHLNENFHDGEINIDGFSNYRADRTAGIRKGGVIVYVKDDLLSGISNICSGSIGNIEYLAIEISCIKILYVSVYRPPTAELNDFIQVLSIIKSEIEKHQTMPNIVVTGDLNLPIINWSNLTINGGTASSRRQASLLLELFEDYFMEQYVHRPTRGDNILDLFATNDHELVSRVVVEDTDMSDHRLVIIKTTLCTSDPQTTEYCQQNALSLLNFWNPKVDWTGIKLELSKVGWNRLFAELGPERMYGSLLEIVTDICQNYVPTKKKPNIKSIPRDRKIIMRKRNKLRKVIDNNNNISQSRIISIMNILEDLELELIESHKAEAIASEKEAISKINEKPKYFFKYARSKSTVKSPIGPLNHNGEVVTEPEEIGEILKLQFESVYSDPINTSDIEEVLRDYGPRCIEDIEFSMDDVRSSILKISASAAAGPDGFPALLLRNCVEELKLPLTLLWRSSLDAGYLPDALKTSRVVPIFKGGDRCAPDNYRPISLTSHISKLFERIVVKEIVQYLNSMDLFNRNQHGFRSGRSCLSQLLEHQQRILSILAEGLSVDVVYLDFAKAFDKVDYSVLVRKLKALGISGQLLRWLNSFLTGRNQAICVDGTMSNESPVRSGVPQGSSLGPILFLIHIADIDDNLKYVSVSSFADDTRFIMGIRSESDRLGMQEDLCKTYEWALENNMQFNGKKFELLRYGGTTSLPATEYSTPDGQPIKHVEAVKDLGVMFKNSGTFETEIDHVTSKSRRQASWVMRVFKTRDIRPMMTLFKALILPHLEYCCQLWCPVSLGNIRKLEAIQRSFTSRIPEVSHLNYWQRLKALKLYSLERRRERYIMIYVYKIINNLVPNYESEKFCFRTLESDRRGKLCKVPPLISQATGRVKTIIESSFAVRGPKLFNCLPADLRNFEGSVDSFKRRLDKFLNLVPDQPCTPDYHQSALSNCVADQLAQLRIGGIFL